MRKAVLRLVAGDYVALLRERLPPSGRPLTHDLEARLMLLIEAIPEGQEPEFGQPGYLTVQNVKDTIEWLFTSLARSQGDAWPLAAHLCRLDALDSVCEILSAVAAPPRTIGHKDAPPASVEGA
jgi:hypothetical protein